MPLKKIIHMGPRKTKTDSVPTGPKNSCESNKAPIVHSANNSTPTAPVASSLGSAFVQEQTASDSQLAMPDETVRTITEDANKNRKLGHYEAETLRALAAMQIKYGRASEAVPYLMVLRKYQPKNVDALRLLSLAFLKLERWEQSEMILNELDEYMPHQKDEDGLWYLYRSLVSLKLRGRAEARNWFEKFRNFTRSIKLAGVK